MKKLIALALTCALAAPVHAWGDKEQGVVQGIVGTLILQQIHRQQQGQTQLPPPTVTIPYPGVPYPVMIPRQRCRQIVAIQLDRDGNEYRYPVIVCN